MGVSRGIDKRYEANIRPREERKESRESRARLKRDGPNQFSWIQAATWTHACQGGARLAIHTNASFYVARDLHSLGASTEVLSLPLFIAASERASERAREREREREE